MYSEEIIDRKIISCSRSVNDALGTIDFTSKSGDLVFQTLLPTAAQAPEPVVFQVGTADSVLALQAATVVARDVRAIDVNMGCPVAFSTQGGMGSSLLIKPDTVRDILTTLRRNLDSTVPITCKIRLLRDERASVDLLKLIESCGVAAVGVHARHVSDRPRWRAMPEALVPVLDAANLGIPVIYNGDAFVHADLERLRLQTRTQAVMVARGAMWNPCVFEPHFSATIDMVDEYLKIAQQYRNKFSNSKYVVGEIVKHHVCSIDNKLFEAFSRAKDYEQLVQVRLFLCSCFVCTRMHHCALRGLTILIFSRGRCAGSRAGPNARAPHRVALRRRPAGLCRRTARGRRAAVAPRSDPRAAGRVRQQRLRHVSVECGKEAPRGRLGQASRSSARAGKCIAACTLFSQRLGRWRGGRDGQSASTAR